MVKHAILGFLTGRTMSRLFHPLTRGRVAIFCAHRFREPGADSDGTEITALRDDLAYLRREGYAFPSLGEALERLRGDADSLHKAVVFTIDDGYQDFHDLAAPVFAEFDCPATVFLPTGFLDGQIWLWWDRIEYIVHETCHREALVDVGGPPVRLQWSSQAERRAAAAFVVAGATRMPEAAKLAMIDQLGERLEVEVNATPPAQYAPMSWDQVRTLNGQGFSFGPHTVTHPVLSRTSDDQVRHELQESWTRLCEELDGPLAVFAYPNGQHDDFGPREADLLAGLGMTAAVSMVPDYASRFDEASPLDRYAVPRFCHPHRHQTVVRIASGLERVWHVAQRLVPGLASTVAPPQHPPAPVARDGARSSA